MSELTTKQKQAIKKLCREYATPGQASLFRNLAEEIIQVLEREDA